MSVFSSLPAKGHVNGDEHWP